MAEPGEKVERQLRLLFSWQEELRRLEAGAPVDTPEGEPDRAAYGSRIQEIQACIAHVIERERGNLEQLASALRSALQEQAAEEARIAGDPDQGDEDATYLSRLNDQIAGIRQEIAGYNRLLRAQRAADLGGVIVLPLEQYPEELDAAGLPWRPRHKPRPRRLLAYLSPADRRTLMLLPVALVLAVLAVLYVMRWRGDVAFEIIPPESPTRTVRIICENVTARDIVLHAPWPENYKPTSPRGHYGINVYARMTGDNEFRYFPSMGLGWTFRGESTGTIDPITVPIGLTAEVQLDLGTLRAADPNIAAIRIECTRARGAILADFEYAFPAA